MKHPLSWIIGSLSAFILLIPTVTLSIGQINVLNCSKQSLYVGAADWDDALGGWIPYSHAWLEPQATASLDCEETWIDSNAPGCKIVLNTTKNALGGMGMGRKDTGNYYAYYYRGCYIFKSGNSCPSDADLKSLSEACN